MSVNSGYTATHWGNFSVQVKGNELTVGPAPGDQRPSPLGENLRAMRDTNARILTPVVRRGYLTHRSASDGRARGHEPFVAVSWDEALDLAAGALTDVRSRCGDEAIYGGSYGWASAGRFHNAPALLHHFLRLGGGYTDSVNTYSGAAAEVILPHIIGMNFYHACAQAPTIADMVAHCRLVVSFGGAGWKNNEVGFGGVGNHRIAEHYAALRAAGVRVVSISPLRDDSADALNAQWLPCRPNTDTALMLGLCHCLLAQGVHDRAFLDRYCHGYPEFEAYLLGHGDGIVKDAQWAAHITGVNAHAIQTLAAEMARQRTVIGLSLSVQRAQHGEQPYWAATALAAMLGQIGLPGGGIAYAYAAINMATNGRRGLTFFPPGLPKVKNPVQRFIPVARIAAMLEKPGQAFDYNGQRLTYPDIKLIYWAGGNPFHHHQDLQRLNAAWSKPETVIVNESFWTATARRADIVFPVTTLLERMDFVASMSDVWITPMAQVYPPLGEARCDYEVFAALAQRLRYADEFTQGRSAADWVRHLYEATLASAAKSGVSLPPYDEFVAGEPVDLSAQLPEQSFVFEQFRANPDSAPLSTETGKIQIFSARIAGFGYADCLGHPCWYARSEWLGAASSYPLHLVSNQPANKLHSQLDHGAHSQRAKQQGREPVRINPADAAQRDIHDGNLVRLFNARGATLAVAQLSDAVMPGVVQLATGAWYDPQRVDGQWLEVHGNPNALTLDEGTSSLSQGPVSHSCLCEVERYTKEAPPLSVDTPPMIVKAE